MSDQIIESQKALLVEQAVKFEAVVKSKKGTVTWDNNLELENYVQKV